MLSQLYSGLRRLAAQSEFGPPRWGPIVDQQAFTGVTAAPGRARHARLLVARGLRLANRAADILDDIFLGDDHLLPFEDVGSFRQRNRDPLIDLFGAFFGDRRTSNLVGMVWLQPFYVSMRYALRADTVVTEDRAVGEYEFGGRCLRTGILMGFGSNTPNVRIRPYAMDFGRPHADVRFVRVERERSGVLKDTGERVPTGYDENLGMMTPDDPYLRQTGHPPSYAPFLKWDGNRRVQYIDFRVLHLARMFPYPDGGAWVESLIVPIDPRSGAILLCNTARREFDAHVQCYAHLGLADLLKRAIGWEHRN